MLVARRWALAFAGLVSLVAAASLFAPAATATEPPDWSAVANVDTVSVATSNPDGTLRYTTVWLAVVGGRGYLRTGNTTWGGNVDRNPSVTLVIGKQEYALRAEPVETDDERAQVMAAFNQKYGWSDTLVGWFFRARPKILRLASL